MNTVSVGSVKIAYTRTGKGKPLVLIHGFPLDGSTWNDVLPLLEGDFDLILPDLRGFGGSTPVNLPFSLADMADDIAGLLDQLNVGKCAMAGHSMGGYIALAFTKKYPNRLSGLGLVSSQTRADTQERRQGRYKEAEEVEKNGLGLIVDGMTSKLSADIGVQTRVRDVMSRQGSAGVIGALKAMADRQEATEVLSAIKYPLVIVHGDNDMLIPIERARELKADFPHIRLVELDGVGHMPMMEAPEKTAEALRLLK